MTIWQGIVLATALAMWAIAPAASSGPRAKNQSAMAKASKAGVAPKEAVREVAMPFHIGEKLNYRVAWATFSSAASVELIVPERRELYGWKTWHFRALAHTLSPLRTLFTIDDQFDSYTDASTLECRQYEMYLNEMGRKQDHRMEYIPQGQPMRGPGPAAIVLPETKDPLGALYALRAVDWQHTPEVRTPVYDGHDVYEMHARVEIPKENLVVAAGSFSAARISIRLYQHGKEVPQTSFAVWFSQDPARTPVLMESDRPFGTIRAELVSASQ